MLEIIKLGTKADLLSHKLSVPFPPPQEMMQSTFGGQGQVCRFSSDPHHRRTSQPSSLVVTDSTSRGVPMPGELADQIMTVTVPFGLRVAWGCMRDKHAVSPITWNS